MRHATLCGIFALACLGCVSESDKKVLDSTRVTGEFIAKYAPKPYSQAGDVVVANCVSLRGVIGAPAVPVPTYNPTSGPGQAARYRDEADAARRASGEFWNGIKDAVTTTFPWAGAVIGIGGWVAAFLRKQMANKKLAAIYNGVNDSIADVKKVMADIKAKDASAAIPDVEKVIVDALRGKAVAMNVYEEIRADLKEMKANE